MSVFDCSLNCIAIATAIVVVVVSFLKWTNSFWERHGVPSINNKSSMISSTLLKSFFTEKEIAAKSIEKLYKLARAKGWKHIGISRLFKPMYIPVDADLIKNILQTDFAYFMNHGTYLNERDDPLQAHLFHLRDSKWRKMRVKLTPTFTSGKMKMMFGTLAACSEGLKEIMDRSVNERTPTDIKEILARFTTDIIGSAAFGIECNSLKDPDAEFRKYGKKVFENDLSRILKAIFMTSLPEPVLKFFRFKFVKPDVEKFFMKVVKDTIEYREKNNIYRKDFMHLLIQLKNLGKVTDDGTLKLKNGEKEEALSFNEVAAQAFVFFIAGFETSSTLMTFTLFELAQNQEIQTKLRNEINTVLAKHNNELTYDCINDMKYLEQVLNESLRKHPPIPLLPRGCSKDYYIPELSATIPKDTRLMIPTYALHHDPEYYPNPEKFDPERFSEENKAKRHPAVWIPFGEGPRLCIGMRFGMMQSKVGIVTLLKNYKLTLNEQTKMPMKYDKYSFILSIDGRLWLNVDKV